MEEAVCGEVAPAYRGRVGNRTGTFTAVLRRYRAVLVTSLLIATGLGALVAVAVLLGTNQQAEVVLLGAATGLLTGIAACVGALVATRRFWREPKLASTHRGSLIGGAALGAITPWLILTGASVILSGSFAFGHIFLAVTCGIGLMALVVARVVLSRVK